MNYTLPLRADEFLKEEFTSCLDSLSREELSTLLKKHYCYPDVTKDILEKKVSLYDSSSFVNGFIYDGNNYWLDKAQRNSLLNLFSGADPEEEFEVVCGNVTVKRKAAELVIFLRELEKYAYKCFIVTQKHLNAINTSEDFQELVDYDYTQGYPEKLML